MMIRETRPERDRDAAGVERREELVRVGNPRKGERRLAGERRGGGWVRAQLAMEYRQAATLSRRSRAVGPGGGRADEQQRIDPVELGRKRRPQRTGRTYKPVAYAASPVHERDA